MINMVKEYRKEKNITQEDLAAMVGISRKYLSMIERNRTTPSIDIVVRLANGLSVNVERLFYSIPAVEEEKLPDTIKFIDLFCGIGGFRYASKQAFEKLSIEGECMFSSDIDKFAQESYEANFHEKELQKLHQIAKERQYDVLTLVLRGDADVLYERYMHRIHAENRHPVHLSTTLDVRENFMKIAEFIRKETILGETLTVEATDFAYQSDPVILHRIDDFMKK